MPCYSFSNPSNPSEPVDIVMSMNDEHIYIKDGVQWDRVWCRPNASVDSKWDCHSEADFINKSYNKKGSYGDLLQKSEELSRERAAKDGIDPLKEKYHKDQRKKRGGKPGFYELKEKADRAKDQVITI